MQMLMLAMVVILLPGMGPMEAGGEADRTPGTVLLPDWSEQGIDRGEPFTLDAESRELTIWARPAQPLRIFFHEFLPGLFERSLLLDELQLEGDALIEWIFTGDRGGFTVQIGKSTVGLVQRHYDSFGFNQLEGNKVKASQHPEQRWLESTAAYQGRLQAVTVTFKHGIDLAVALNGRKVLHQACLLDINQHQLRITGKRGRASGALGRPACGNATVRVDIGQRHQTMLGFGGITTPTAYAQLSPKGKRRWWEILCEYNLLIHREYPTSARLNRDLTNYDRLADATPHYYGDNFPNGETSDFDYLRTLRQLGGKVLFELWDLPLWAKRDWQDSEGKTHPGVADSEAFARAVIRYCRLSEQRTGAPPDIVGIQNEKAQPPEIWHEMTLVLRRELDRAGFNRVRIHMSDAGGLHYVREVPGGIERAKAFRRSATAWEAIDYAATHLYDYQYLNFFSEPDGYDQWLHKWRQAIGDKPFLSTELCINHPLYQADSFRLALLMGQLYHRNLATTDAVAVCYCWLLVNTVQPSYGWTRTLMVPDKAHGFIPAASSHQLRVFGAYSRRIREGMVRIGAASSCSDLLATAFAGPGGARTVVLLNRGCAPRHVRLEGLPAAFRYMEAVDPYRENEVRRAPAPGGDGSTQLRIASGAVITLSTVPLRLLPEGFALDMK